MRKSQTHTHPCSDFQNFYRQNVPIVHLPKPMNLLDVYFPWLEFRKESSCWLLWLKFVQKLVVMLAFTGHLCVALHPLEVPIAMLFVCRTWIFMDISCFMDISMRVIVHTLVQRTVPRAGSGLGASFEPCSIIVTIDCRWYRLPFVFQRYCQTSRMRISLFNFILVLE